MKRRSSPLKRSYIRRRVRDILRRNRKPRPPKKRHRTDPVYRSWILNQPCIVTGKRPVEGHHVRRMTGMGLKPSDYRMVPVWWEVHREVQGRDRFWWARRGIDIEAVIRELNEEFFALARTGGLEPGSACGPSGPCGGQ